MKKITLLMSTILFLFFFTSCASTRPEPISYSAIAGDLNVIGHRGAAGLLPENTMAGFKKAMEI